MTCEIPCSTDGFIDQYINDARRWQQATRPPELHFNHGEYINRHGDAIQSAIEELKKKSTSNRAVVTLVDNQNIVTSGDGRLPSLLVIQIGLDAADSTTLLITAYFRALEVSSFLPVNFAELQLISNRVVKELPVIERCIFTVFAFRAHFDRGNRLLHRSQLDISHTDGTLSQLVLDSKFTEIAVLLEDKSQTETIIDIKGIDFLITEMSQRHSELTEVCDILRIAAADLRKIQQIRSNGSHSRIISTTQRELKTNLMKSAQEFRKLDRRIK
ncbi:hypothetical protein C7T36_02690 [Rhodococcus sp. AD45-ID]|nr:hypothetical protein C7T36_02690 [Rhodococcus sp. AD45-ID]